MSYQIRIPSTNSDKVGNGGAIEPGTPDYVITFPNESGEVATTSDIPQGGSTTIYILQNTYSDEGNTTPQVITEWDVPVIAGKLYKFEYSLFARTNNSSVDFKIYYQTSSFTNPLTFGFGFSQFGSPAGPSYDLSTYSVQNGGLALYKFDTEIASGIYSGFFKATETATLRHLVENPTWTIEGGLSASYVAGESFLQVTQLN